MGKLSVVLSVTVLASGGLNLGSWILDSSFCTPKGICLFQKDKCDYSVQNFFNLFDH